MGDSLKVADLVVDGTLTVLTDPDEVVVSIVAPQTRADRGRGGRGGRRGRGGCRGRGRWRGTGWDRVAGGSKYFPYGEEQQVTAQDKDKFATYYRDGTTGLDYAQNRYYANTLGRFTSPDPFQAASPGPADPQSWNKYVYTRGDPVNRFDPSGLDDITTISITVFGTGLGGLTSRVWKRERERAR